MANTTRGWIIGVSVIGGVLLLGLVGLLLPRLRVRVQVARPSPVSYQSVPIPAGTNAPVRVNQDPVRLAFLRRTMIEAYQTVGKRDPAWDETAVRFMEGFVQAWSTRPVGEFADTADKEGQALVQLGCTDPLILYLLGVVAQQR